MIKCTLELDSIFLQMPLSVHLYLPYPNLFGKKTKNLWALHCALKNGSFFINELGLSEIVDRLNIAVIAPDLGNSFFVDTAYLNAGSFLKNELKPLLSERFKLSDQREDNLALGISMGAYGVANWLFSEPACFKKVFLISGVYDFAFDEDLKDKLPRQQRSLYRTISSMHKLLYNDGAYLKEDYDLQKLLRNLTDTHTQIAMFCGADDVYSLWQSRPFCESLKHKGFDVSLSIASGGHDTAYWRHTLDEIFNSLNFAS